MSQFPLDDESKNEKGECSENSGPLVPGPARPIHVAIKRKKMSHASAMDEGGNLVSTQEVIRKVLREKGCGDDDFEEEPWLTAVNNVCKEGRLMQIPANCAIMTTLSEIPNGTSNWGKVAQVVAMIKQFEPNGLGDAMVTLKDPTGTIEASIHKKVFTQSAFAADIRVGSVLVLKKVSVARFGRSNCVLNITVKNIDKVFTKDNYLPEMVEQMDDEGYVSDSDDN